ncbi:MAG: hypothetical protein NTU83_14655 [Candidatus Hydrogenedentes bacterium]|nr:hypothetical protein [Candidatus Hydrogenedentota bacterium]
MKHIRAITVTKAHTDTSPGDQVSAVLSQIFTFVTNLIEAKGKTNPNTTAA